MTAVAAPAAQSILDAGRRLEDVAAFLGHHSVTTAAGYAQVRADLDSGRQTFAWRIEPQSIPAGLHSYRFFPTVDNIDSVAYGENRGARLFLKLLRREWDCLDGLDNDEDGRADCADADCGVFPQCRHPDFDRDGDVDQEDFGHLQACFTVDYPATIIVGCEDTNLNNDSRVDAADLGLFLHCIGEPNTPATPGCMNAP